MEKRVSVRTFRAGKQKTRRMLVGRHNAERRTSELISLVRGQMDAVYIKE
jgi:hypothetical protein